MGGCRAPKMLSFGPPPLASRTVRKLAPCFCGIRTLEGASLGCSRHAVAGLADIKHAEAHAAWVMDCSSLQPLPYPPLRALPCFSKANPLFSNRPTFFLRLFRCQDAFQYPPSPPGLSVSTSRPSPNSPPQDMTDTSFQTTEPQVL